MTPATSPKTVLDVKDLCVDLSGRRVLDGVSFSICEGELVSLIGPNGAGKTTILRAVLGLLKPTSGTVVSAAGPSQDADAGHGARKKRVFGYVPQQVFFDRNLPLRVKDVVGLGVDGHRLGFSRGRKLRDELVAQAMKETGISALSGKRVGSLSGGEQKKVMIAHALASDPRLLLLDEPLANLDLGSQDQVVEVLNGIAKSRRVAVFLSAHDINPLVPVTDKVVFVSNGKAAYGSIGEVMTSEILSSLYGHRVDVFEYRGRIVVLGDHEGGHHHDSSASGEREADRGW